MEECDFLRLCSFLKYKELRSKEMNRKLNNELRVFYLLWSTQSLSQLGSAVTSFALTLWLYEKTGSALSTAALTICTYSPYVVMSIFAGAISDKFDKKKTMLICDALAALATAVVFVLYRGETLEVWHLYLVNVISGLMNTVQQPASEVAYTRIIPREYYQKTGGLQSLSRSLISVGNPVIAAALYGMAGLNSAIAVDLISFVIAFITLAVFIKIPDATNEHTSESGVLTLAREGLAYLRQNKMVLDIILFMDGVNFIASAFDAVLPAFLIPHPNGGNNALALVSSCSGIAMVAGSIIATVMPSPKNRVRIIYLSMLFSLGTENFSLAFSDDPIIWCIGQTLGWILVLVMSTNQNVIMRESIPDRLQGRVYACRNTLQFFTIPLGLLFGGFMADWICVPVMSSISGNGSLPAFFFGSGKAAGAALMLFVLGAFGLLFCLIYGKRLSEYK